MPLNYFRIMGLIIQQVGPVLVDAGINEVRRRNLEKTLKKQSPPTPSPSLGGEARGRAPVSPQVTQLAKDLSSKDPKIWGPDTWVKHDKWIDENVPSDCAENCQRSFREFSSAYRDVVKAKEGKQPYDPENLKRVAEEFMTAVEKHRGAIPVEKDRIASASDSSVSSTGSIARPPSHEIDLLQSPAQDPSDSSEDRLTRSTLDREDTSDETGQPT